jgi:hypothetical protein
MYMYLGLHMKLQLAPGVAGIEVWTTTSGSQRWLNLPLPLRWPAGCGDTSALTAEGKPH